MPLTVTLYFITVLTWGTSWYLIKFQLGVVPVEWSLFYRFAISAALLFAFCILTQRRLTYSFRDHIFFVILGACLFSINYLLLYFSAGYLTSGIVAVIFSALTFMNMLNGAVFLRRRPERNAVIGSVIGIVGILVVFQPELSTRDASGGLISGLVFGVLGTYSASLGNTLVASRRGQSLPTLASASWGMAYGAALMMGYALVTAKPIRWDGSFEYVASLAHLSVAATVIAFVCYLNLIARIGAARAAYAAIAFPVIALVVSTIFEGYQWQLKGIAGVALILFGNIIALQRRKQAVIS